ncbi:MAG TPA: PfkB family carbohydrate kinase [Anaerolineales bacterium]
MTTWDIVVVGGINIDLLARSRHLPVAGYTVEGDLFRRVAGGKGANQAVAAVRLGASVALVGCIGDDETGQELLALLDAEGIDNQFIVTDNLAPTGVTLTQVDSQGKRQSISVSGANCRLAVSNIPSSAISTARAVLVQMDVPIDCVREASRLGHAAGAKVILDPSPPIHLPDELLRLADVVKPNAHEAEVLTGIHVHDRASARVAADRLRERGVKAVAIQAGNEGNLIVWEGGVSWNPLLPVKTVDTTGGGDAFTAALAVALAEGQSLEQAGPFANAAAALATTDFGPQTALPTRAEVEDLLHKERP